MSRDCSEKNKLASPVGLVQSRALGVVIIFYLSQETNFFLLSKKLILTGESFF